MKKVGYIRVSTNGQNLARQKAALMKYLPEDMIVSDKKSGKDFEREGYSSLKNGIGKLVKGDELYITSLDRLGRNKDETLKELQYYKDNGIRIRVLDIPTTMMEIGETESQTWIIEMINNILIEVLASLAEQERKTIKERQAEGIDQMPVNPKTGKKRSLKTGRDIGRPVAEYPGNWKEVYAEWKAKKITAVVKLQLPAGKATPGPPVGSTLGPHGINIPGFTKEFNEKTRGQEGLIIPVVMTIYADRSFEFVLKTPPAAVLIKKALNIQSGSAKPNKTKVATITEAQLKEIAETKMPDLNAASLDAAISMIKGTCRSMGVKVEG